MSRTTSVTSITAYIACGEYSSVAGWTSLYARGHGQLYCTSRMSWHCGDPHSDTTSTSVYTTVKLPTLCTRKCYQESAYRCMYCIPFIIFYVHVLKLRSCMLDASLRRVTSQPLSDRSTSIRRAANTTPFALHVCTVTIVTQMHLSFVKWRLLTHLQSREAAGPFTITVIYMV